MTHLDIILPFYNGSKFIEEQLNSIQVNDLSDIQVRIILVNDASDGQETAFVKKLLPQNHVYIENEFNLGVIKSVEKGLKASTAEYIMLCDQDDVWLPKKIKNSLLKLQTIENHQPALIYTDLEIVGRHLEKKHLSMHSFYGHNHERIKSSIFLHNIVTGCTIIMNRKLLKVAVPFPTEITMHDHWLAVCAAHSGDVSFLNEATILYRQHGNNQIGAPDKGMIYTILNLKSFYKKISQATHTKVQMIKHLSERLDTLGLNENSKKLKKTLEAFEQNRIFFLINKNIITGSPLRILLTSIILFMRRRIK